MPFEFSQQLDPNNLDSTITLLWKYDELDIVEDSWRDTVHTLSIVGKDANGIYVNRGKWCIHMNEYNDEILTEHSNNIRNLPQIDLNIQTLFPKLKCLSLTHLNINNLILPNTLYGWVSTDTQMNHFNMPSTLYWLTLIYCYGCWSKCDIPKKLYSLSIYGDYCDNFKIPFNVSILNIISCKFNRLSNVSNLYIIKNFNIRACSPYNKIITSIRNTKINIHKDIQSIVYKNKRMDAENTTDVLVLLRNKSMNPKCSETNIRTAFVLGSNYPRRAIEFMVHL
jgi:hypothetical protein